ncbi:MAG: high frequency lysogenization protein HflD [Alphaproteobacteria bacterium]|nr:MAG: high frequency lysogenization protein HflD [Alphaproteobacteria bacterium]
MLGFLALGFVMGMSHALEADHLAAMAAMSADRTGGRRRMALRGAFWGLGHTVTLFLLSGLVLVFGFALTEQRSALLEAGVGVMLVGLGVNLLWRLARRRVHFHAHSHGDGGLHLHAHSHAGETGAHAQSHHDHDHPAGLPWRALLVGLMHGAAGSAGLLALALAATQSAAVALAYIVVFGIGSMAGMAALTFVVAWPLGMVERAARVVHLGLVVLAAALAIGIGIDVVLTNAPAALGAA